MNNIFNKLRIMFLSALILVAGSCNDFEEMNTNPNEPPVVPTSALLTSAQKQLMDHIWDEWHNGRFGLLYAQYWAANEYTDESRYQLRENVNNNYWLYYYSGRDGALSGAPNGGGLRDLQEIIELNQNSPEEFVIYGDTQNQIAVARIMKAWMFQIITDVWGDVPYFEALKGAENVAPAYTPQAEIYADLLKELTEASAQITTSESGFTSGDLIYGGDMEKWKKFANSLKLRVAIRMADRDPGAATAAIQQAVSAGVFESNDDNALLPYLASVPNNNPLNQDRRTRADNAVSKPLIDLLLQHNDPRIKYYADPNASGNYVGLTYGLTQAEAGSIPNTAVSQPSGASNLSFGVLAPTAPGIYMEYSEVLFTLAEATQRGFITGSASGYYNQAIEASIEFWASQNGETVPSSQVQGYLSRVPYNAADWKQSIGEQKWLALYMQGIQGWTEWRRLDFEGVLAPPAAGPLQGTGIPLRVTYPLDERNRNRASLDAAISRQGADALNTPVWWDVD